MDKWDDRFFKLANHIADWSKDPTSKVGAVIVKNKKIISIGYNGFPKDIGDYNYRYDNKSLKRTMVIHAEVNAILNANNSVAGSSLYTNKSTCHECAKIIIQSGIVKVFMPKINNKSSWVDSQNHAKNMYQESGVEVIWV